MKNFFESGKKYFFNLNGNVHLGVLQYCDDCGVPCHTNSVKIVKASKKDIMKRYNSDMDNSYELSYDELTDSCICGNC